MLDKTYSFTVSICDFLGMISSRYGPTRGYVAPNCSFMERCADDFSLDLAPTFVILLSTEKSISVNLDHGAR